jgi:SAM-dependent methyltransferase
MQMIDRLKCLFIKKIYADHNDAGAVKSTLGAVIAQLPTHAVGLNIGAGKTQLHPRIKNLEIGSGPGIDYVGSVEKIPCDDGSFDLVVTQEVLEHVPSLFVAIQEIHRFLKAGGFAYIQLPFVIGFHPCPNYYWWFTHKGLSELVLSAGLTIVKTAVAVGPAVGLYRILVEFLAILFSVFYWRLYKPFKLLFSILCYPIKWLDPILARSREANRIAVGFFIVCQKT